MHIVMLITCMMNYAASVQLLVPPTLALQEGQVQGRFERWQLSIDFRNLECTLPSIPNVSSNGMHRQRMPQRLHNTLNFRVIRSRFRTEYGMQSTEGGGRTLLRKRLRWRP